MIARSASVLGGALEPRQVEAKAGKRWYVIATRIRVRPRDKEEEQHVSNSRRPLRTRSARWAKALASLLVRWRISPNSISVTSIAFAAVGAAALLQGTATGLLVAGLCIQLRLACNLLDGMVAVEGGLGNSVGALYNEIPDRIADSLLIIPLGYVIGSPWLGWLGALAAAVTAYIRVLGGALGFSQDFRGPQAKQHRMAIATLACVIGAIELRLYGSRYAITAALWVIAFGSIVTCGTRTRAIARLLQARN